ncbi:MAG: S8 family serine peptidase [Polyangiaceae bacterium]
MTESGVRALSGAKVQLARSSDFAGGAVPASALSQGDGVLFDQIGVAVLPAITTRGVSVAEVLASTAGAEIEDEWIRYASGFWDSQEVGTEYLRGYRDGVNRLIDALLEQSGPKQVEASIAGVNEKTITWGLAATLAARSPFTGRGVKVAILDTGIDLTHPDFADRNIVFQSFVDGEEVQDGHGHGTHTAGTACGPRSPSKPPRYGVACDAELYVGKVLSNEGSGGDIGILAGIDWALRNGCRVISMSLGSASPPLQAYDNAGAEALKRGAIVIAAAGNESERSSGLIAPVGSPANAATIMAVAAVDVNMDIADFSCAGRKSDPRGRQVDIAGPGVDVLSSYKGGRYRRLSGTSMATPHVAGLAALLLEANPQLTGPQLWELLTSSSRRLFLAVTDVGAGLAQAPMSEPPGKTTSVPSTETDTGPVFTPSPAPTAQVAIVVSDAYADRIVDVEARAKAVGLTASTTLDALKQITGTLPIDKLAELKAVEGVKSVSISRDMALPPPTAPVQ